MNRFTLTRTLCVAVLLAGGAVAAQAQALPAPSSGWVAAAAIGVFQAGESGRDPPVYSLSAGWEHPLSRHLVVRGVVSRLKGIDPRYDMRCRIIAPNPNCLPEPEFPAGMWALEGALIVSPAPATLLAVILGGGAGVPRGNLEQLSGRPEGVVALWRAGIEVGPPGHPGVRFQLAKTWLGHDVLSAESYLTAMFILRSR